MQIDGQLIFAGIAFLILFLFASKPWATEPETDDPISQWLYRAVEFVVFFFVTLGCMEIGGKGSGLAAGIVGLTCAFIAGRLLGLVWYLPRLLGRWHQSQARGKAGSPWIEKTGRREVGR